MTAELIFSERYELEPEQFVELTVWKLQRPLEGSNHPFKYSLAFVVKGECVLRYDNEQGKGDHKHLGNAEAMYNFTTLEKLQVDFWQDVNEWGK